MLGIKLLVFSVCITYLNGQLTADLSENSKSDTSSSSSYDTPIPQSPYPTEVYPYDPYEPYDPYDPYPFYFCELNEDEYGRPYYGPYDEYRSRYQPTRTYPRQTQSDYTSSDSSSSGRSESSSTSKSDTSTRSDTRSSTSTSETSTRSYARTSSDSGYEESIQLERSSLSKSEKSAVSESAGSRLASPSASEYEESAQSERSSVSESTHSRSDSSSESSSESYSTTRRDYARPLTTMALPPAASYEIDVDALARRVKRQSLTLPSCITNNECNKQKENCTVGYDHGTEYDKCGRRCTCRNGYLEDCCRVRKEWRSMTQVERCHYIRVIFFASTVQPWKSCYDDLIRNHRDNFGEGIHSQNFFLPWHRWYILAFENLLRKIDCRVTVPYWDWSLESLTWQNSIVWATQCGLGGNGEEDNGNIVGTGPFKQSEWQLTPSATGVNLMRNFNGRVPDCASIAEIQRLGVAQFNSWHPFISSILHDSVHCRIGGTMCSRNSLMPPNFSSIMASLINYGKIGKTRDEHLSSYPTTQTIGPQCLGLTETAQKVFTIWIINLAV